MEKTRQLFFGDASLAAGFKMAGFETFPDAKTEQLDQMLEELRINRTPAFVVIDERLAESGSQRLQEARREGGRILLTQVPPLTDAGQMKSSVDAHIQQLLGTTGATA